VRTYGEIIGNILRKALREDGMSDFDGIISDGDHNGLARAVRPSPAGRPSPWLSSTRHFSACRGASAGSRPRPGPAQARSEAN
jgi:hypothetical protein